jgi:hypothetical protein
MVSFPSVTSCPDRAELLVLYWALFYELLEGVIKVLPPNQNKKSGDLSDFCVLRPLFPLGGRNPSVFSNPCAAAYGVESL